MVDKALIMRKLSELEEYLTQAREYEDITASQYAKDWKTQRIVERTLQMMIETCVDIAAHIISDEGYRIPKSYADTFTILHQEKILEKQLSETMEKMTRFRNVIVHDYDKVDTKIVVTILRKHLDDFLHYKNAIVDLLQQKTTV